MRLNKKRFGIIPIIMILCVLASSQAWANESAQMSEIKQDYEKETKGITTAGQSEVNESDVVVSEAEDSETTVLNDIPEIKDNTALQEESSYEGELLAEENQDTDELEKDSPDQSVEAEEDIIPTEQTDENALEPQLNSSADKVEDSGLTGFKKVGNEWLYYENGQLWTNSPTVARGKLNGTDGWWYIDQNGKANLKYTGFAENKNGWWYVVNGKVDFTKYDVVQGEVNGNTAWYHIVQNKVTPGQTVAYNKNKNSWWYIDKNGKADFSYTGFAKNKNGWWYCRKGVVDFSVTNFIKGTIEGKTAWWYVKNNKADLSVTDIIYGTVDGKAAWWYVKDNIVTKGPTVAHNHNGWYYINSSGYVDFKYNGFAKNKNGWWYCKTGKVDFSITDIIYGTVDGKAAWWNLRENKVTKGPTVAHNHNGWYYINSNGYVDFNFNGFAKNKNGWWYCKNGKVDFSLDNCMIKGTLNGINASWYVDNNKVIVPTVIKTGDEWVYVDKKYKLNKSYTGFAKNKNGWWYCKDGVVDFSVTSVIKGTVDGKTAWWYVEGNEVTKGPTVARNSSGWWYINKNGYVDFSYNGFAKNKNGWWYCKTGKVDFSITDIIYGTVNGVYGRWNVINNKVIVSSEGTIIMIPEKLGKIYTLTYYSDKGFVFVPSMRTSIKRGSNQERVWKVWKSSGAKYDNGLAEMNGAYLVAVTSTFGEVGDLLKITYRSGDTMLAVIADEKSQEYVAWDHNPANVYGHNNGANVVEFEVDPAYYGKYNHPSSPIIWNNVLKNSGGVEQIQNLGHKY